MKRRISLFDPFYKNVTVYVGLGLKVYGWFVVINLVNLEITVRLFTIQSFTLLKPECHVILLLKKSLGFVSVPVVCRYRNRSKPEFNMFPNEVFKSCSMVITWLH